jgi:signal transduction histidine kinase/DNA-binding response OmpR family regulator
MSASHPPIVLIVDDQPANLDALEVMLEPTRCAPLRALSAEEALLRLLQHDVAAIVLDIRMPGMNGLELARLIKQRRRSQHIPIIFLTAHAGDETDVLRGYGAGAVEYLSKPVNGEILRSKIGVFVDLFRTTRALAEANEALEHEVAKRVDAQKALERANEELEHRVQERTGELLRATLDMKASEERLRMAMDVARLGAWEWELSTATVTWSSDPEALFDLPPGTLGPGLHLHGVMDPDDRARIGRALAAAFAGGSYEFEYRILRPAGAVGWIAERGALIADEFGDRNRIIGISRDVTLEREIEQQREWLLRRARAAEEEAERQGRLKDEFLATLSHELRTPMNAILGWLSFLRSGKAVADPVHTLTVIERNAQMQARLIDDLLDMTRLMLGSMPLQHGPVHADALVGAVVQSLSPIAAGKSISLTSVMRAAVPPFLADAGRLQQVLWNLVHNAIKFTPEGGRVEVVVDVADDEVRIAVSDNGCGIEPDFLPFVFDRFRQQDSSLTRESSGLGIGLSIAKQLVELHQGRIEVHSEGEGRGAAFIIRMPLRAPDGQEVDEMAMPQSATVL